MGASRGAVPDATVALSGANIALPPSLGTGPSGVLRLAFAVTARGPWQIEATGVSLPPATIVRYEALRREQTVVGQGPLTSATSAAIGARLDVPTTVSVHKRDAASGASVPGAVIEIRRASDATGTAAILSATTASDPVALDLPPGDYAAVETREPTGYVLDDALPRRSSVTMLGGRVDLVWRDTPATPTVSTAAASPRIRGGGAAQDVGTDRGIAAVPADLRARRPIPRPVAPGADGACATLPASAFASAPVIARSTLLIHGDGSYRLRSSPRPTPAARWWIGSRCATCPPGPGTARCMTAWLGRSTRRVRGTAGASPRAPSMRRRCTPTSTW